MRFYKLFGLFGALFGISTFLFLPIPLLAESRERKLGRRAKENVIASCDLKGNVVS